MTFFKDQPAGEIAARLVGVFAFIMMDGLARHVGTNLAIAGIVGACFFVPYWKLGQLAFGNTVTFRDLFRG